MVTSEDGNALTTVGLDVSDKTIQACFLDHHGEIVEESRLKATDAALRRRFSGEPRYRIVLEAGSHSPWMSRLLLELGHEVYVANPRRLRAILREREQERPGRRPVSGPHRPSGSDFALPLASPLSRNPSRLSCPSQPRSSGPDPWHLGQPRARRREISRWSPASMRDAVFSPPSRP